ncbi:gliding motility-associated C-terminal domain-containing protein [Hufsiella ginkgonis]|uniref:T9SS type B sorting domain-containing protein n=1 Tax=Hufsiella ginkgonis TaxID=2695274 RepID=A0A7K1Y0I1_9SPHI|nr:gliding motility-associated C-terminal domain-containing protein [Hufsiella ginkgonis]MXV16791.1 T9SS type B sorting domain-containing protein [Hufsiella ginkgonis]
MFRCCAVFLFLANTALAAVAADFVVTTNAAAGAGSLREALTNAANNGSATEDRILFNLPGNTVDDRTILVNSLLPELSSNLVIDGTSQPGSPIGDTNAKVMIKSLHDTGNTMAIFKGTGITGLGIYGLFFNDENDPGGYLPDHSVKSGIELHDCERITIGKKNAGNIFNGYNLFSLYIDNGREIHVSANGFGTGAVAGSYVSTGFIFINKIYNLYFGGTGEGNVVLTNVEIVLFAGAEKSVIRVADNNFGTGADEQKIAAARVSTGFFAVRSANGNNPKPVTDLVLHNNVFAYRCFLSYLAGNIAVHGNYFATSRSLSTNLGFTSVEIADRRLLDAGDLDADLFLGTNDPGGRNYFANSDYGIHAVRCSRVRLVNNSFTCVTKEYQYSQNRLPMPAIALTGATASSLKGVATPGTLVEIFLCDHCSCSAQTLVGSVTASPDGNWEFPKSVPYTSQLIAIGSLGDQSSGFTKPFMNSVNVKITASTCGKGGAIWGVDLQNAPIFKWVDVNGNTVGTSSDLRNVSPGKYKLVVGEYCAFESEYFEVKDEPPAFPIYPEMVTPPQCGRDNGAIEVLITPNGVQPSTIRWENAAGVTIGSSPKMKDLPAGEYALYLGDANGCEVFIKKYTLVQTAPLQVVNNQLLVTPDECGQGKGGVSGLSVTGGTAPFSYAWKDALGGIAGTSPQLTNAKAGTYTLVVTDNGGSACGTARFTVTIPDRTSPPDPVVPDIAVCAPGAVQIRVTNPWPGTYNLYTSPAAVSPVQQSADGLFTVPVTEAADWYVGYQQGSCASNRVRVSITIADDALKLATLFTPNGDGINDTWTIHGIQNYPRAMLRIYNRNGEEIFRSKGYAAPFTGKIKERELPMGVYYYLLDLGTDCKPLSGSLMLVR